MFQGLVASLRSKQWGTKTKDGNMTIDSGVQVLADEIARGLEAYGNRVPIDLEEPLVFNNKTGGPAIIINNTGNYQHQGIWITDADGRGVRLGIGFGSEGINASELTPLANFMQDPEIVYQRYSDLANSGGTVTRTPGTGGEFEGVSPGPGFIIDTDHADAIGSGYGQGTAGEGIPYHYGNRAGDFTPPGGVGEMLSTMLQSDDTLKFQLNGSVFTVGGADDSGGSPTGGGGASPEFDAGNSGTAINIDWTNGVNQKVTVNDTTPVLTFSAIPAATAVWLTIRVIQDATASRAYSLAESIAGVMRVPSGISIPIPGNSEGDFEIVRLYSNGTDLHLHQIDQYLV